MAAHLKIGNQKVRTRLARKRRIRKRIRGSAERPRLIVFRSNKHIYAQAVDDDANTVVATSSDLVKSLAGDLAEKDKKGQARVIGKAIGAALLEKGIKQVVFDRNGYIYHGRVKELAEGAREAGLEF